MSTVDFDAVNTTITLDMVREAFTAAMQERGEAWTYPKRPQDNVRYTGCRYRWTQDDVDGGTIDDPALVGKPACAVGEVFARLDLLDALVPKNDEQEDGRDAYQNNMAAFRDFIHFALVDGKSRAVLAIPQADGIPVATITVGARYYLAVLQDQQDAGACWADADAFAYDSVIGGYTH